MSCSPTSCAGWRRARDDHPGLRHPLPPRFLAARTRHLDRGQRPGHTAYREDGRTGPTRACRCEGSCTCRWPGGEFVLLGKPSLASDWNEPGHRPRSGYADSGHPLRSDRVLRDMPRVHTGAVDHPPAPVALPRLSGTAGERTGPPACRPVRPLRRDQHPNRSLRDARPGRALHRRGTRPDRRLRGRRAVISKLPWACHPGLDGRPPQDCRCAPRRSGGTASGKSPRRRRGARRAVGGVGCGRRSRCPRAATAAGPRQRTVQPTGARN